MVFCFLPLLLLDMFMDVSVLLAEEEEEVALIGLTFKLSVSPSSCVGEVFIVNKVFCEEVFCVGVFCVRVFCVEVFCVEDLPTGSLPFNLSWTSFARWASSAALASAFFWELIRIRWLCRVVDMVFYLACVRGLLQFFPF